MKKILLAALAALPLAGCVTYPTGPGGYSAGAWNGYDGGFDFGYQGYERPVFYADNFRGGYAPQPYYQQPSYAPQPYYPAPGYGGGYSTYYCPPGYGQP